MLRLMSFWNRAVIPLLLLLLLGLLIPACSSSDSTPPAGPPPVVLPPVNLDNDGDGLVDAKDDCPQEAGPPENRGCPPPTAPFVVTTCPWPTGLRGRCLEITYDNTHAGRQPEISVTPASYRVAYTCGSPTAVGSRQMVRCTIPAQDVPLFPETNYQIRIYYLDGVSYAQTLYMGDVGLEGRPEKATPSICKYLPIEAAHWGQAECTATGLPMIRGQPHSYGVCASSGDGFFHVLDPMDPNRQLLPPDMQVSLNGGIEPYLQQDQIRACQAPEFRLCAICTLSQPK